MSVNNGYVYRVCIYLQVETEGETTGVQWQIQGGAGVGHGPPLAWLPSKTHSR